MTDEKREQVVELLRVAADLGEQNRGLLLTAANVLGHDLEGSMVDTARRAWNAVWRTGMSDEDALLEAAQRVEEGTWP